MRWQIERRAPSSLASHRRRKVHAPTLCVFTSFVPSLPSFSPTFLNPTSTLLLPPFLTPFFTPSCCAHPLVSPLLFHPFFWSCPHLAKPHLAKKIRIWPGHFRDRFWPNRIWPELVFGQVCVCVCVSRFLVGDFKIFGGCLQDFPRTATSAGPALRWTAQNFALFFLSPAGNFILSSLSWGSSRGILVVFEGPGPWNVHIRSSRVVVWAPAAPKPPPFVAPPFGEPFGAPPLRAPTPSGPHPFGPPPLRAPTPSGPHPFRPQPLQAHFPRSHMPTARPALHPTRPPPEQHSHRTPTTNTPPPHQKKNWPNAVWPNSVKQNWPNSAK